MPKLPENAFTFVSHGLPEDTFTVVRFNGEEGLSTLYRFVILLVSEREDVDLDHLLQNPATLTIKGRFTGNEDVLFHGILATFEQMHQVDQYVFYRAELRPRAWWLTLTHHNQVFLNKTVEQFVQDILEDGGLAKGQDFDLRVKDHFPPFEYVCQYQESHFDFFSRWCEFGGVYYWFEQGRDFEKLLCTDSLVAHVPLAGHKTFVFSPPSGLDAASAGEVIKAFSFRQSPVPRKVMIRDYNYMQPSLEMRGQSDVSDQGRGEVYLWGEHFRSKSGGDYLARVRAERFRCASKIFRGVSSIPALRPGYLFTLAKHYRQDFNQEYLTTLVRHEGSQERWLVGGLGVRGIKDKDALFYRNTFECIPGKTQFRPPALVRKPIVSGTFTARVDAAGSGQYAELDEHGRYKVVMPFDLSGREGGKASTWLRMATPYAGENFGMHFPLLKGTEVLLSFEEGDIDRPIIVAAVHNQEKPNPVTDRNEPVNAIRTAGGSYLAMGDEKGREFIRLACPGQNCMIQMGAVSGNNGEPGEGGKHRFEIRARDDYYEMVLGNKLEYTVGSCNEVQLGQSSDIKVGVSAEVVLGPKVDFRFGPTSSFEIGSGVELRRDCLQLTKKQTDFLGYEGVRIAGGAHKGWASLLNAWWPTATTIAALCAANALKGQFFHMQGMDFENLEFKDYNYLIDPIIANMAMGFLISKQAKNSAEKIARTPMAGEISADVGGVRISGNKDVSGAARVRIETRSDIQERMAGIVIDTAGIECAVKDGGRVDIHFRNVRIEKDASKIDVREDEIAIWIDNDIKMHLTPEAVALKSEKIDLEVDKQNFMRVDKKDGIQVKGMSYAAAAIKKLNLDGQLINIG